MRNSLILLLILLLIPVTFNGCGEEDIGDLPYEIVREHPTQGVIRVVGVGLVKGLNTTKPVRLPTLGGKPGQVLDWVDPTPTYQDGLDTVGWGKVAVRVSHHTCLDKMCTGYLVDHYTWFCFSKDYCDTTWKGQPITEPIMKPLQQVWLKPDQVDRLMELIQK